MRWYAWVLSRMEYANMNACAQGRGVAHTHTCTHVHTRRVVMLALLPRASCATCWAQCHGRPRHLLELDVLQQRDGVAVVGLRLVAEAADEVTGQGDARHGLAGAHRMEV